MRKPDISNGGIGKLCHVVRRAFRLGLVHSSLADGVSGVLRASSQKEVVGVHAAPDVALVANALAVGDNADNLSIYGAVRAFCSVCVRVHKSPVTILVKRSGPQETAPVKVGLNPLENAFPGPRILRRDYRVIALMHRNRYTSRLAAAILLLPLAACSSTSAPKLQIMVPSSLRATCERPSIEGVATIGDLAAVSIQQEAAIDVCDARRSALVAIIDGVNPKPAKRKFLGLF